MKRRTGCYGKLRLGLWLLLLPLTVWFGSWRKIAGLWRCYRQNEEKLEEIRRLPAIPAKTACRLPEEAVLREGSLLEWIRRMQESREVTILNYVPWLAGEEEGLQLYTAELTLAGGFIPMLKIAAALEQEEGFGGLAAARFHMETDVRNREKQLQLTLWIQQLTEK